MFSVPISDQTNDTTVAPPAKWGGCLGPFLVCRNEHAPLYLLSRVQGSYTTAALSLHCLLCLLGDWPTGERLPAIFILRNGEVENTEMVHVVAWNPKVWSIFMAFLFSSFVIDWLIEAIGYLHSHSAVLSTVFDFDHKKICSVWENLPKCLSFQETRTSFILQPSLWLEKMCF